MFCNEQKSNMEAKNAIFSFVNTLLVFLSEKAFIIWPSRAFRKSGTRTKVPRLPEALQRSSIETVKEACELPTSAWNKMMRFREAV